VTARALALAVAALAVGVPAAAAPAAIRVGSKPFTESYILAEIVARIAEEAGEAPVERRLGLGDTGIVFGALEHGDIDVYPEYTGTISRAILKSPALTTRDAIVGRLASRGLVVSRPLGFANTYALAVRRETAARLGLRTIGDLARHPELRAAFSPGFFERDDGWPGLRRRYRLPPLHARIMEHALTYRALAARSVDVIDVYSTDGRLSRLDLVLLADDARFFPDYAAVLLARRAFVDAFPRTWQLLDRRLAGRIDAATMSRLNAAADLEGESFRAGRRLTGQLPKLTAEHLALVTIALVVAVALGVPLGVLAARRRAVGQVELAGVGLLQTIPALALLAFMIPLFGIGARPALVALCLYALLPIVRNVYTGLISIDPQLLEVAGALGLSGWQRLAWIELPLASINIMAGVKTSAVLTVGTATLAAFIGAGGYGTLIVTGLALNDVKTILSGAGPAALMALAIHGAFEALDRVVVPRALRRLARIG
jgi:osmoprotectant transport system permease protein